MDWMEILLLLLPTFVLCLVGYLVRFRKAYWLISGYNTMSAEKKKNVDTAKLGVLIGNMLFAMGALMFTGILLIFLDQSVLGLCVLGLVIPMIIFAIISAQKYDGNTRSDTGEMKKSAKVGVGVIVGSLLIVLGLVGYLLYQGMQPTLIILDQDKLNIAGSYGQSIPVADIQDIQLLDTLPEIQLRTNGSAIGQVLRGHFRLADKNQVMLYLDRSQPPFIYLVTSDQMIYLNNPSPEQTRQLFEDLKSRMSK